MRGLSHQEKEYWWKRTALCWVTLERRLRSEVREHRHSAQPAARNTSGPNPQA